MECSGSMLWVLQTDHDEVTMERENSTKVQQTTASMKESPNPHVYWWFANLGKVRQTMHKSHKRLFHGGNTGSNPVGDAKFQRTHRECSLCSELRYFLQLASAMTFTKPSQIIR